MIENLVNNLSLYLQGSVLLAFLAAYLGGVVISFTPCTYPLIPVTVGFIGAQGSSSKLRGFFLSLFYVGGIAVTYSILGGAAALSGRLFGQMQTTTWTYLIMGNLCLIMGLSMLDVFSIALPIPQKLMKLTGNSNKKGFRNQFSDGCIVRCCYRPLHRSRPGSFTGICGGKDESFTGHESAFCFCLRYGHIADYRRHVCRGYCLFAKIGKMDDENKNCFRVDINWRG